MHLTAWHVDDLSHPGPAREAAARADVAVVIDVIRAFTVAPWCLERGAAAVLLASSVEAAVAARDASYPDALLLKDGPADPRFALPNAPGRIAREDLTGRTVVQRTGNGTRGAHAVARTPLVLCSSFVTAAATAEAVRAARPGGVVLIPTEGDEDWALADYLAAVLHDGGARPDPSPYLDRVVRSPAGVECAERGADEGYPGVDPDDLARCLELDRFDHALRAVPQPDGLLAVHRC